MPENKEPDILVIRVNDWHLVDASYPPSLVVSLNDSERYAARIGYLRYETLRKTVYVINPDRVNFSMQWLLGRLHDAYGHGKYRIVKPLTKWELAIGRKSAL